MGTGDGVLWKEDRQEMLAVTGLVGDTFVNFTVFLKFVGD